LEWKSTDTVTFAFEVPVRHESNRLHLLVEYLLRDDGRWDYTRMLAAVGVKPAVSVDV
jgi:hypothetical protein